jgi:hypothetical protein
MTQPDFIALLEADLRQRPLAFDRAELLAFVASMWPWVEDDPDVGHWAQVFAESGLAVPPG